MEIEVLILLGIVKIKSVIKMVVWERLLINVIRNRYNFDFMIGYWWMEGCWGLGGLDL